MFICERTITIVTIIIIILYILLIAIRSTYCFNNIFICILFYFFTPAFYYCYYFDERCSVNEFSGPGQ